MNELITNNAKDFFNVDLSSLADTIDKLSGASTVLTIEEKQAATNAVRQWERVIKEQIDEKRKDANRIIQSLRENSKAFNLSDGEFEAICTQIGIKDQYDKYVELTLEIQDKLAMKNSVNQKYIGINLTKKENAELRYERDYEIQTILMEVGKLQSQQSHLKQKLVQQIANNSDVKNTIKEADDFLDRVNEIYNDATLKAQKVRLNISINDPNVREALHELLAFSIKK